MNDEFDYEYRYFDYSEIENLMDLAEDTEPITELDIRPVDLDI